MKYTISLFCLLINSITFIQSADPCQQTNPLGLMFTIHAKNKTRETAHLQITLIGLKLDSHRTYSINIKPGETISLHRHTYSTQDPFTFSGIALRTSKPTTILPDSPILTQTIFSMLPTGRRKIILDTSIKYAKPSDQVGMILETTNTFEYL